MNPPWFRRPLVAVLVMAATLLVIRLGEPDWTPSVQRADRLPLRYVWDECIYAFTAHRYIEGDPHVWRVDATPEEIAAFDSSDLGTHVGYRNDHPVLAPLVMAASSSLLGWSPFAVRLPGALCGVVIVLCTGLLAHRVRGERVATLAAALVALDGVWFTISRLAIPHVYVAAATAAALVTGLIAWQDDARRARFMLATGALCGLGLAFKETAVMPLALLGALLLVRTWTKSAPGSRGRGLAAWAVAFLVLPPAVYLASWLPFFVLWDQTWDQFVAIHRHMFAWHGSMPASMGPSTPMWTWPFIWKPVRLFEEGLPDGTVRQIFARGNPFLWWAAAVAVPWAAVRFARRRAAGDLWIVAGYLSIWLLYAFIPRFGFSYYMLPAAPCAAAAVATALDDACGERDGARRAAFWTFAGLAAGVFAAHYAWLAAVPQGR